MCYRRWKHLERNWLDIVSLGLIIVGAVNWGLVGLFNLDLVELIFGTMSLVSRIIYTIIGISGVYALALFGKLNKE